MSGTIEQLKELKELLDQGVLTQEEFDAQKKEILEKPKTTQVAPEPAIVAQPATMQPGMMQPGMMQPGMMQPGMPPARWWTHLATLSSWTEVGACGPHLIPKSWPTRSTDATAIWV